MSCKVNFITVITMRSLLGAPYFDSYVSNTQEVIPRLGKHWQMGDQVGVLWSSQRQHATCCAWSCLPASVSAVPTDCDGCWPTEAKARVEARVGDATFQDAFQQAAAQARASYAPYSQCPAGLAVITANQDVYAGPYIESAAFNPSLSPLQAAIIVGVIDSMPCYTHVSCVLGCPC